MRVSIVALAVDPRDSSWSVDRPIYRVYFFGTAGASDEWRLDGADSIHQIIEWADANASGRDYVVYVEVGGTPSRGLVRLVGLDPSAR
jgi:hypothetical protein